ncbi:hypothetical protein F5888DRAFT_219228 [Russula emetica]|nr:hypothetical protein F5888DRAFT_219228 [Russula emetica]
MTTIPTSILPASTSNQATPSSTFAAAVSNSTSPHGASFWAGIALLCIAGVATIITLFVWWLRVRKRTHRRPWESRWPWRRRSESYNFPEDAISSSGLSGSWWQPHGDRDVGEPRRSTSRLLSSSRETVTSTGLRELQLPALAAVSPFTHGPYPTVRPLPLELRLSDTTVPGLMQDVGGSLRVANLVAGDILTSGDESSRPPTALDDVGTPREFSAMFRPRYLSLNGSGLDVPWVQTHPAEQEPPPEIGPKRAGVLVDPTTPLNNNRWKERLERSSVRPEDLPQGTIEGWRDSLRNNIASAFGVFTSAVPAPVRPRVITYDWQQTATTSTPAVGRAPSTVSMISKPWTLEETRDGAGVVHIRGVPDPTVASSSSSSRSNGRRALPPTPSSLRSLPPSASLIPPILPHLPPMPQVPRTSTSAPRSTSTKGEHGSRRRRVQRQGQGRPRSWVRRSESSASEAISVGSDMSRSSTSGATAVARWMRLSEKEEAARRALRQRRHRQSISSARRRTRGVVE